ncbi:hypothetical protein HNY73_012532 [Argiope bruennichi]|uniref:Uncharacterized protein n=1 Tax=Argiope bruennichi TaxID=94029 RepID=A0A8T0F0X4_ARGBR|nr:hypothetical protein HNY73_012532 [Argiope bruennichi]
MFWTGQAPEICANQLGPFHQVSRYDQDDQPDETNDEVAALATSETDENNGEAKPNDNDGEKLTADTGRTQLKNDERERVGSGVVDDDVPESNEDIAA